ncbi:predicted protein [Chaetomium globosum CBS 148.51]|uniref:Centromere protein X n=1 Tax=Chaetomium globosum (strain ATCC 6205 / CBS 148.51 / DSM 1962 / NBRC 6347 / NRRL 1970) TaxID=306901 RepID=Q2GNA9_CHAGB|nr:uncharacterized protein CHGG_10545 [Chaetomium globosum CBS 148.51]EAQ84141.1 predicted protein [Chaetomium globosum CBS 148.51]
MPPRASGSGSASRGRGRGGASANKSTSTGRGAAATASSVPRRAASRGRVGGTSRGGRKRPQQEEEDDDNEEEQPGVVDLEDGDVPMQGGDRAWDGGVDGFGVPGRGDDEGGGDYDEEEEGREKIPPELLTRILHAFFEREGTRITRDANAAVARYMDIFVREAIARAAVERSSGFLEVEDLEKIAPQLLMDL